MEDLSNQSSELSLNFGKFSLMIDRSVLLKMTNMFPLDSGDESRTLSIKVETPSIKHLLVIKRYSAPRQYEDSDENANDPMHTQRNVFIFNLHANSQG